MQSTFLYMLAGLAAMSVGVDAAVYSQAVPPPTYSSVPASNSTNSTGQEFVCYPANQAIFTIVTTVIQSTFFPSPTGTVVESTFFPNATDSIFPTPTGTVVESTFFPNATDSIFPSPTGSVVESTFFPNATDSIFPTPTGSVVESTFFPSTTA
ncbi:hypothetical protein BJ912DRAFT_230129 [Pholiota molesta]|nr:hypothetical protein BJ912DRAFT_230129 [Pholiota molesta]